jgi:hypothetical protein
VGKIVKIAILLPDQLNLAILHRAKTLIRLLNQATPLEGGKIELAVGLPLLPESEWRAHERQLKGDSANVVVRHLQWERVSSDNAKRMFASHDIFFELSGIDEVVIPRDWGWNFSDCDVWINFADPDLGAVFPLKPVAHYCSDLAVRIAPFAFSESIRDPYWNRQTAAFRMWRQRALVLTSDPYTIDDLISYAGVRRASVMQVPNLVDDGEACPSAVRQDGSQLIWWMEPNELHAIQPAAEGLRLYLAEGGTMRPVIATESDLENFELGSLHRGITELPFELRKLLSDLPKERVGSHGDVMRLVARSGRLWSSCIAGGEGYALYCAARASIHFLGVDFPLQRDVARDLGISASFYAVQSPRDIASKLHLLEQKAAPPNVISRAVSDHARATEYSFVLDRLKEMAGA